jgi:hypothetical protein
MAGDESGTGLSRENAATAEAAIPHCSDLLGGIIV